MSSNEQTPRRRLSNTFQYLWRLAVPFWMFRDAGRGSVEQRIANYRYNRERRKVLPFYLWKWMGIAFCMFQLTRLFSDLMSGDFSGTTGVAGTCAALFCMSAGIGFALSCVVITVLAASYLYLTYVKR